MQVTLAAYAIFSHVLLLVSACLAENDLRPHNLGATLRFLRTEIRHILQPDGALKMDSLL
jgi:hypothetical protein